MPSFDVISEVDKHELTNAVDQANREITTRFDFKGTNAKFEMSGENVTMVAPADFQLKQMQEILNAKVAKRGIDVQALEYQAPQSNLSEARQQVSVVQGINQEVAKKIVKAVKNAKLKVQAQIQGEQVRITGKKRDDLQAAIALLKEESLGLPLQFDNFRD